jgi:hypothetical protein
MGFREGRAGGKCIGRIEDRGRGMSALNNKTFGEENGLIAFKLRSSRG